MTGAEMSAVGLGWSALLASLFFSRKRVPAESGPVAHPGRADLKTGAAESRVVSSRVSGTTGVQGGRASPGRGWPGRVPGLTRPDPGRGTLVAPPAESDAEALKPRVHMGVSDAVNEFVTYMLTGFDTYRLTHEDMLAQYRRWALEFRVALMPETIFLAALGRHPAVSKARDRVKGRDGSVVRLDTDARSPKRVSVYVIKRPRSARASDAHAASAHLPGKVPVADVVPAQTLASPSERRAAAEQQELPFRRAA